ncbi:hypothetical protein QA601_04445 [Chitinispirillales bacterium ANBcel5]|uniref:hypothetical protein n=1 Tax=Cellulosispirillum alkaliphilum TaxID=3039283 RepID=UPI002A5279BD|nr:hypothetical protein [Chitinispirillales bacterium ANBcel5]
MRYKQAAVIALIFGASLTVFSQTLRFRGSEKWGYDSQYEQLYGTNSLQEYRGTVIAIDTVTPMHDMSSGIKLVIESGFDSLDVHLGPAWYVLYQDINLSESDNVEVRGRRANLRDNVFIMAKEIRFDDGIIRLRDDSGIPYWVAVRRR